jgi:integrase
MVHKGAGRNIYRVWVPTPTGRVLRSTGTKHKPTARQYDVMLHELGPTGARRWDLLGPVVEGRLELTALFDAWRTRDLDGLLARLRDVDLAPLKAGWKRWLLDRVTKDTADRYVTMVETLAGEGLTPWLRSSLTQEAVATWLNGLTGSGGMKRKYAAALASFVAYAREVKQLTHNPLADISLPAQAEPASDFLERDEVERLVAGSPSPYAELFALIYGTSAEATAAVNVRRRDVDLTRWMVRMPGTKTHNRDRVVIVAEWARPWLAKACVGKLPDAKLFEGIDRWKATKQHKVTLEALEIRHLKLHAARNHWAVRALRGGWSVEAVSRQMGHANAQMVLRVYGRWIPRQEELARLEAQAEREAVRRVQEG